MSTLIIDKQGIELKTEGFTLVIYEDGARRANIPIKSIERFIIVGATIKLETGVIQKIMEAGGSIMMMSSRFNRRNAFVLGNKHNDAAIRIEQTARFLEPEWAVHWSKLLVLNKLKHQLKCLNALLNTRPEHRRALFSARNSIQQQYEALSELTLVATNNEERVTHLAYLRGVEGSATRQWFSAMAAVFPSSLGFSSRNRRPPRDPVNAVLSLGYTVLHYEAVRAIHIAGLEPLIGFYHQPSYGRESLASDLIESLRPYVDRLALTLFSEQTLRKEHFGYEENGACLLHKAGRSKFYEHWEKQAPLFRRYLRAYCRSLVKSLKQEQSISLLFDSTGEDDEGFK